jgi:hypothetical protein
LDFDALDVAVAPLGVEGLTFVLNRGILRMGSVRDRVGFLSCLSRVLSWSLSCVVLRCVVLCCVVLCCVALPCLFCCALSYRMLSFLVFSCRVSCCLVFVGVSVGVLVFVLVFVVVFLCFVSGTKFKQGSVHAILSFMSFVDELRYCMPLFLSTLSLTLTLEMRSWSSL